MYMHIVSGIVCELPSDVEVSVGEGEGEGAKTTDRLIVVASSDVPYLF